MYVCVCVFMGVCDTVGGKIKISNWGLLIIYFYFGYY